MLRAMNASLARTDLVVTTAQREDFSTELLMPDALGEELRAIPGVARIAAGQSTFATLGSDRVQLRGVQGDSSVAEWDATPARARDAVRRGDSVVVTSQLARYQGLHEGDVLTLPTPLGERRLSERQ